jgi:hypothetical protein
MLKELFVEAFHLWDRKTANEKPKEGFLVYDHFKIKLEPAINQVIEDLGFKGLIVKASVGMGNLAEIPWIGIRHDNAAQSFEQGEYVVYLFSPDFGNLYLTINQGVSRLRIIKLEQKAVELRGKIVRPKDFTDNIIGQLSRDQTLSSKPGKYQKGSIYARKYELLQMPDDAQLRKDLEGALESYQNYVYSLKPEENVFWKFSPGEKATLWNEFEGRKIISMGSWGQKLGNLNQWPTVEDIKKNFPGLTVSGNPAIDPAHQLIQFRDEVELGHIIVAYGNNSIYGFGRVTGIYEFDENHDVNWWDRGDDIWGMQHWRKIDWFKVFTEPLDISAEEELYKDLRQRGTIHRIKSALNGRLQQLMKQVEQSSGYPTREHLEKAIKALGNKSSLDKEEVLKALEAILISENIKPSDDWKSKTWENIVNWADERRE